MCKPRHTPHFKILSHNHHEEVNEVPVDAVCEVRTKEDATPLICFCQAMSAPKLCQSRIEALAELALSFDKTLRRHWYYKHSAPTGLKAGGDEWENNGSQPALLGLAGKQ